MVMGGGERGEGVLPSPPPGVPPCPPEVPFASRWAKVAAKVAERRWEAAEASFSIDARTA